MRRKKWKGKDKAAYLLKIGQLIEQGYTLPESITFLTYEQTEEVQLLCKEWMNSIADGSSVHESLRLLDYPEDVLAFLYFSEHYGSLEEGFKGAGRLYSKKEEIKEKVRILSRYPILLIWILSLLCIMMVHYLFPQFNLLFSSMDMEFPLITRVMIKIMELAPLAAGIFVLTLFISFLYYMKVFRRLSPHTQMEKVYRIPVLSHFFRMIITYYFSSQLSSLLKGGLTIHDALTVFERQDHLFFFQEEGKQLKEKLKEGIEFPKVIDERGWFLKDLVFVIHHGQTSGKLAEDLYFYQQRLMGMIESLMKKWVMALQPSLFLVVGALVLALFLSIFLPIFQLMTSLG